MLKTHNITGLKYLCKTSFRSAKSERRKGKTTITDEATLKSYCEGKLLSTDGRRTPKEWKGKHTKEIGFDLELKNVRNE